MPRRRAKIGDANAAVFQVMLERFLQFEAAVIGADGYRRRSVGWYEARNFALFNEVQQGSNALLDLIAAIHVDVVRTADWVADVLLEQIQRFVKLAQQKRLLGGVRESQHDGI